MTDYLIIYIEKTNVNSQLIESKTLILLLKEENLLSVNKIYQVEINNETSTHRYRQECNGVRVSIYHITVECNH